MRAGYAEALLSVASTSVAGASVDGPFDPYDHELDIHAAALQILFQAVPEPLGLVSALELAASCLDSLVRLSIAIRCHVVSIGRRPRRVVAGAHMITWFVIPGEMS